MSGHELCTEGVYDVYLGAKRPAKPPQSQTHPEIKNFKDKVIEDLTAALKHYSGISGELALRIETDLDLVSMGINSFLIKDKNGVQFIAKGEAVALKVLSEYNLIE